MAPRYYVILEKAPLGTLGRVSRNKQAFQVLALEDAGDGRTFGVVKALLERRGILEDYEQVDKVHYFTLTAEKPPQLSSAVPQDMTEDSTSFIEIKKATRNMYNKKWEGDVVKLSDDPKNYVYVTGGGGIIGVYMGGKLEKVSADGSNVRSY